MIKNRLSFSLLLISTLIFGSTSNAQDIRMSEIRHINQKMSMREYQTREQWEERAGSLRRQILVSAGLWPMPSKGPLKPEIFGKVDRGDYTIEKVYFESFSGFYVTGNLYRPKNLSGKAPAVLCPHGHWTYGRLENTALNSGPVRAAGFARQGYVAFSYDMVGYNDSTAIPHTFADHNVTRRETLWGVNLLGLQLWNSIRVIDFLLTLPDVDPARLGMTGESGGGTQTFLLSAVDDRVKTASPVNMISFIMQGGSLCENAPNLRIDTNNVEIGALMAPRPLFMVSATGDWTKNTLTDEFPAIRNIYRLYGAEDKVAAIQVDAPHNYNQPSREAVYGWFAHWLLGKNETTPIKERSGGAATLPDLLVYYGRPRPANELNERQLADSLIELAVRQLDRSQPVDNAGLDSFKDQYGVTLKYSLMAEYPDGGRIVARSMGSGSSPGGSSKKMLTIARKSVSDSLQLVLWEPENAAPNMPLVLLVGSDENPELTESLVRRGNRVATVKLFPGGRDIPAEIKYFTTYNRTDEANRVQDILTTVAFFKESFPDAKIRLIAQGKDGLAALLARGLLPAIDKTAIDVSQFDNSSDEEFLKRLPVPGIRRAGDLDTAVTIAPMTPLLIYNTGGKFQTKRMEESYRRFGKPGDLEVRSSGLDNAALINWISSK